jgi:hypothetical protein
MGFAPAELLIEDTAHHAGHADSTREMLDGRIMRP